jgi:hypothetical protein
VKVSLKNGYEENELEEPADEDQENSEELIDFPQFGKILGVIEMRDRIRKFERIVRKKFGELALKIDELQKE